MPRSSRSQHNRGLIRTLFKISQEVLFYPSELLKVKGALASLCQQNRQWGSKKCPNKLRYRPSPIPLSSLAIQEHSLLLILCEIFFFQLLFFSTTLKQIKHGQLKSLQGKKCRTNRTRERICFSFPANVIQTLGNLGFQMKTRPNLQHAYIRVGRIISGKPQMERLKLVLLS